MVPFVAVAMPKTSPMKGGELAVPIAALDWVFAEAKDCMIEIDGSEYLGPSHNALALLCPRIHRPGGAVVTDNVTSFPVTPMI